MGTDSLFPLLLHRYKSRSQLGCTSASVTEPPLHSGSCWPPRPWPEHWGILKCEMIHENLPNPQRRWLCWSWVTQSRSDGHWQSCMWGAPRLVTWKSRISPLGYVYTKSMFLVQGAVVSVWQRDNSAGKAVCAPCKQPPRHGQNTPNQ